MKKMWKCSECGKMWDEEEWIIECPDCHVPTFRYSLEEDE